MALRTRHHARLLLSAQDDVVDRRSIRLSTGGSASQRGAFQKGRLRFNEQLSLIQKCKGDCKAGSCTVGSEERGHVTPEPSTSQRENERSRSLSSDEHGLSETLDSTDVIAAEVMRLSAAHQRALHALYDAEDGAINPYGGDAFYKWDGAQSPREKHQHRASSRENRQLC